jgi:hypothetical protein
MRRRFSLRERKEERGRRGDSAGILVVRVEGAAPQVMDAEAEHNHLEKIYLLSADLASGFEHVAQ